jgi:protein-L-isoaspartate(D-aspartate) O-methyltransferase
VIHIGAGTGYYTAILAQLVGPNGCVDAYEINPALARRTRENLATYRGIRVHPESAVGRPLPTADLIYVSAGVTGVPTSCLDALDIGGRLLLPLTPTNLLVCMLLVTRRMESRYAARVLSPAAFIACVGVQDDEQSRALAAVMTSWSPADVRSLRRGYNPNEAAWRVGTDSWLSAAEP